MEGKLMFDKGTRVGLHIERGYVWMRKFALKQERGDDQAPLTFMSFKLISLVCIFLDLVDDLFQVSDPVLWEWAAAAGEVLVVPRSFSCFLRSQRVCQIVSLRLQD